MIVDARVALRPSRTVENRVRGWSPLLRVAVMAAVVKVSRMARPSAWYQTMPMLRVLVSDTSQIIAARPDEHPATISGPRLEPACPTDSFVSSLSNVFGLLRCLRAIRPIMIPDNRRTPAIGSVVASTAVL